MKSDNEFKVRASTIYKLNQGDYVFFRVNLKDMFGVGINYPGIKKCLNTAFLECKQYIPYDTGITYRSFTQKMLNEDTIENFFDPKKVLGQNRKGHIVDTYYVAYIASTPKNYSWLTKVIYQYYETLFREVSKLKKAREQIKNGQEGILSGSQINTANGKVFVLSMREQYRLKREEAKRIKEANDDQRRTLLFKGGTK